MKASIRRRSGFKGLDALQWSKVTTAALVLLPKDHVLQHEHP
jgi:hypothetical protein